MMVKAEAAETEAESWVVMAAKEANIHGTGAGRPCTLHLALRFLEYQLVPVSGMYDLSSLSSGCEVKIPIHACVCT